MTVILTAGFVEMLSYPIFEKFQSETNDWYKC